MTSVRDRWRNRLAAGARVAGDRIDRERGPQQTVIFVEGFRLLLVFVGTIAGLEVGDRFGKDTAGPFVAVVLGALIAYVIGGVAGRLVDRTTREAVVGLQRRPAAEIFAASVVGTTGLLLGIVAGLPMLAFVHSNIDYPVIAIVAWVLCLGGVRLGVAKGRDISRAVGISHLLEAPSGDDAPGTAIVVDTSVVLDRALLALGRAGLLAGGLMVPRFVLDEVHTLVDSPDPVSSRRARRGLEALEVLRVDGVAVHVPEDELPGLEGPAEKSYTLARRRGMRFATCSSELLARARVEGVRVLDLRRLTHELSPDRPPGERLRIDLVKPGRQARQAVGYLPEGDMVVVNDAAHLVGQGDVEVVVSSSRQTSQGLLVFAHLAVDLPVAGTGS